MEKALTLSEELANLLKETHEMRNRPEASHIVNITEQFIGKAIIVTGAKTQQK